MHELTKMNQLVQGLKRLAATHVEAAQILHELVFAIGENCGMDTGIGDATPPPANESPSQSFVPQIPIADPAILDGVWQISQPGDRPPAGRNGNSSTIGE